MLKHSWEASRISHNNSMFYVKKGAVLEFQNSLLDNNIPVNKLSSMYSLQVGCKKKLYRFAIENWYSGKFQTKRVGHPGLKINTL